MRLQWPLFRPNVRFWALDRADGGVREAEAEGGGGVRGAEGDGEEVDLVELDACRGEGRDAPRLAIAAIVRPG